MSADAQHRLEKTENMGPVDPMQMRSTLRGVGKASSPRPLKGNENLMIFLGSQRTLQSFCNPESYWKLLDWEGSILQGGTEKVYFQTFHIKVNDLEDLDLFFWENYLMQLNSNKDMLLMLPFHSASTGLPHLGEKMSPFHFIFFFFFKSWCHDVSILVG